MLLNTVLFFEDLLYVVKTCSKDHKHVKSTREALVKKKKKRRGLGFGAESQDWINQFFATWSL